MTNVRRWLAVLVMGLTALAAGVLPGWALEGDAGQPGAFLTYGAGARAMGMGRAFAGLADDATALYWNPGGLANIPQNQIILQHVSLIDQNTYQYLGYDHIFPYIGTLGVGLIFLNQPEAEERDTYDVQGGSFKNQQFGFLLGFGADITPTLAAGGTLKLVNQSMMGVSSTGFGVDIGLMYHPWPMLNIGLAFQNLVAPEIKLKDDAERYPLNMVFGVGGRFFGDILKLDLDISKSAEQNSLKPRLGLEVSPYRDVFVRAGVEDLVRVGQSDSEIALGAGYRFMDFQLDYALGLQTVEMMHKIALSYYFGGFELKVNAEPPTFSPVGVNKVSVFKIKCQTKFEIRLWDLQIRNEANALVKKFSGEGFPPDHIVWDGLMDDTNPMPDGRYRIILTVEDSSGQIKHSPDTFVNIQSILPLGVSPVEMME